MTEIKLKAERRSLPTPALNEGRVKGNIPAELYGMGQKNQHLFLNSAELEKVYAQAAVQGFNPGHSAPSRHQPGFAP